MMTFRDQLDPFLKASGTHTAPGFLNTIKGSKYTNGMTIYSRSNITIVTEANIH
jgi:hypothetical protein